VLAFERYLIDKRLGDRLPEKQGSSGERSSKMVPSCGEPVWLASAR
jgi:hypothetical protein